MIAWGLSDPGKVRKENQDAYLIEEIADHCLLAVVCDGMGGANAGNVASRMALDVFSNELKCVFKPTSNAKKIEVMLQTALDISNKAVYDKACSDEMYAGMGTTLVAALFFGGRAHIINVGDSRAYLANETGIQRITKDHSFVQLMLERGEITPAQASSHPGKNLITRAVGTEETVRGDVFCIDFVKEDSLLLCSDGLSNEVAEQEILFEIVHGAEKSDCCSRLVDIAGKRGAPDNVTVVLVEG